MRRGAVAAVVLLLLILPGVAVRAEQKWDRFRGPNGSGVVESEALPVTFGPEINVVWSTPLPSGHSSPILSGDAIVLTAFEDDRLLTISLNRQTARGRIRGGVDDFFASPVAADDKLFFVGASGKVAVVRPGGSFEVLAVNDLGSPSYATPAIGDGRIYIRTVDTLWAFGKR